MRTTIDAAGRLVVPKQIREQAGIRAGMELDIRLRDGVVEIEPPCMPVKLVREGRFLVMVPEADVPPLTHEDVERTRQSITLEREQSWLEG